MFHKPVTPRVEAGAGPSIRPEPSPDRRFDYSCVETDIGLRAKFTLQAGDRLGDALTAAHNFYRRIATPEQKADLQRVVAHAELRHDSGLLGGLKNDHTFDVTILRESAGKALDEIKDRSGRILLVEEEMVIAPREIIGVAAALHIVKSVMAGIHVRPGEPEGDLLGGKIVRGYALSPLYAFGLGETGYYLPCVQLTKFGLYGFGFAPHPPNKEILVAGLRRG